MTVVVDFFVDPPFLHGQICGKYFIHSTRRELLYSLSWGPLRACLALRPSSTCNANKSYVREMVLGGFPSSSMH